MDDSHEGKTTKYRVIDEQVESKRTNHAMTELRIFLGLGKTRYRSLK